MWLHSPTYHNQPGHTLTYHDQPGHTLTYHDQPGHTLTALIALPTKRIPEVIAAVQRAVTLVIPGGKTGATLGTPDGEWSEWVSKGYQDMCYYYIYI